MSWTHMVSIHARYSPIKDVVHRHEGGVTKSKKIALTGSGRAWWEDEVSREAGVDGNGRLT